jgi:N-acetylglucosamine-6-sulfatase
MVAREPKRKVMRRPKIWLLAASALAAVLLSVSAVSNALAAQSAPNIVFVLTDDLSWSLVPFMPHVLKLERRGVSFQNYFVTDSLCCPSRSSIFTGAFPHNTGVFRNQPPDGGYDGFNARGNESRTFAVALQNAGYQTAMLGKYLNGYKPARNGPAQGWNEWDVAGNGYKEFDYSLNQNGVLVHYGKAPEDYLTDVLSGIAVSFIRRTAGTPFFVEVATFAPHEPYVPAPRDSKVFPGLMAPRSPALDAPPDVNAAPWLVSLPPLSESDLASIDRHFRSRAQSVLAVDKMIGDLQAAVAAAGQKPNTYFVFSSDNGLHMGEHRLMPGKMTAFDTDIRVPLIVIGPEVAGKRVVDEVVENIDLCPTFAELAGVAVPATADGRSLVPLLRGEEVPGWRTLALIEHHGPLAQAGEEEDPDLPGARSGNPPTYTAIRSPSSVYVEYGDGTREYHDHVTDPYELQNTFVSLAPDKKASLHTALVALQGCHGTESCWQSARLGNPIKN